MRVLGDDDAAAAKFVIIAVKELVEETLDHLLLRVDDHVVKLSPIHSRVVEGDGVVPVIVGAQVKVVAFT